MPTKPKHPCASPGCPNLTVNKYCDEHQALRRQEKRRPENDIYNRRWRRASKLFLTQHPLCAECERHGKLTPATVVDHIVPHRGDQERFWDTANWQALCKPCHDKKTLTEDVNPVYKF